MIDLFSERIPVREGDNDSEYRVSIRFDETFKGFDGHFPGRPVLPGVCQILAFSAFAQSAAKRNFRLCEIARAKFLSVIEPGDTACFLFVLSESGGSWSLAGETVVDGKGVVGKVKLRFEECAD